MLLQPEYTDTHVVHAADTEISQEGNQSKKQCKTDYERSDCWRNLTPTRLYVFRG